jgi:hydrogenase maturation protein HypF
MAMASPPAAASPTRRRLRIRVEGVVQGVGFRPYVYRLANELRLGGHVLNDDRGVLIEVEGAARALDVLLARLAIESPPLAHVERVAAEDLPASGERGFRILDSARSGQIEALVPADTATCPDCLAELFDQHDRRYRYPFINCTNCGPRFTIVRDVPYDRPLTTMASFAMCRACRAEYEDPGDRRFHAQPNACRDCGPSLRLLAGDDRAIASSDARDPIQMAAGAMRQGAILAIKGLGGYHLACRADDERVVARLRGRKRRYDKPFALMARDLEMATRLVELTPEAAALLASPARPIVLAPARRGADVANSVAPRYAELGVMLSYTPLHHLLLTDIGQPLVMTSGNVCEEPIAFRDEDALSRLAGIADLFLVHDRPIETRTDDSVVRMTCLGGRPRPLPLRRSRGYVPSSIALPLGAPPLLACGAELKNTFCMARGRRAWVSHHIGDLKNWETFCSFREGIAHFERLFAITPTVVAHDLHPDYLSTRFADQQADLERVAIQHHHAHLAACMAEHGRTEPAIGAIYDGSGYGIDGTVWGGELLVGDLTGFQRAGCLWPVRLPGGDQAVKEPWRMACAWLAEASGEAPRRPQALTTTVTESDWNAVVQLVSSGLSAPLTSSVGRLFDAVAALCGLRARASYEGQAAAELETVADLQCRGRYPLPVTDDLRLDARELIAAVDEDVRAGSPCPVVSARFHRALAGATVDACARLAETHGIATVVLSGGVFQNRLLLELTAAGLARRRLGLLIPELLPPNDGGLAYGQAAVASARLAT